jgi:hypothetical protein
MNILLLLITTVFGAVIRSAGPTAPSCKGFWRWRDCTARDFFIAVKNCNDNDLPLYAAGVYSKYLNTVKQTSYLNIAVENAIANPTCARTAMLNFIATSTNAVT